VKKLFLPFLMIICFVGESIFVDLWLKSGAFNEYIFVPRFVAIIVVFISICVARFQGILYGLIFGFLYDAVYTEILGVYTFSFAILAYLSSKVMGIFYNNTLVASFLSLLMVAILEFYVYGIYKIIGEANMLFDTFMYNRFVPTVLINLIFTILFSYPLKKYLMNIANLERGT